jgi:hypothetical protein
MDDNKESKRSGDEGFESSAGKFDEERKHPSKYCEGVLAVDVLCGRGKIPFNRGEYRFNLCIVLV